jgi:hypothetical protein
MNNKHVVGVVFLLAILMLVHNILVSPFKDSDKDHTKELVVHPPSYASALANSNLRAKTKTEPRAVPIKCPLSGADLPVMYNLHTKLGVSYSGDHWFHMAENFMAQHSKLRANGGYTNSSEVYFNFDKAGFVQELNGITKFMVAIATLQLQGQSQSKGHAKGQGEAQGMVQGEIQRQQVQPPIDLILHFVHYPLKKEQGNDMNSVGTAGSGSGSTKSNGKVLLLPSLVDMLDVQTVQLSSNVPSAQRFLVTAQGQIKQDAERADEKKNKGKGKSKGVCALYKGSIGGEWPTPQRGHWFPLPGDVDQYRDKIRMLCPMESSTLHTVTGNSNGNGNGKGQKKQLVIYQRDLSRKLSNEKEAITMLTASLPPSEWDISVLMHKKDVSPCELAHRLYNVDVLLTPHGFQSMLLLFLPRPSVLFEVFPYKYYKRGYGPLSKEYGITHGGVMSPPLLWHHGLFLRLVTTEWCMLSKQCRNYARNDDVWLTQHGVNELRRLIISSQASSVSSSASSVTKLSAGDSYMTQGHSTRDRIYSGDL